MKNPPAFQFYPQDFLADLNVREMTMEEIGIYMLALCHCWIEDGLPNGSTVVEGWFNQHPTVARCFVQIDGKYRNPRLEEEIEKQRKWREKSILGGKKSGVIRGKRKGGSRVVEPRANSSSSSSSSSSELKNPPTPINPKEEAVRKERAVGRSESFGDGGNGKDRASDHDKRMKELGESIYERKYGARLRAAKTKAEGEKIRRQADEEYNRGAAEILRQEGIR